MKNYDVYSYQDGKFEPEEKPEPEVQLTWKQILLSPNCLMIMVSFVLLAPLFLLIAIFRKQ